MQQNTHRVRVRPSYRRCHTLRARGVAGGYPDSGAATDRAVASSPMRLAIVLFALAACQSSDVSRQLGARCDLTSECDERCLAPSPEWPGGFCTTSCDSDDDCAYEAACIDEGGAGVCAFTCTLDPGCTFLGTGYGCKERDVHGMQAKVMVCRGS